MISVFFNRPVPGQKNNGTQCTGFDWDETGFDLAYYVKYYCDAIEHITISGYDLDEISKKFIHIPMNVKLGTNIYRGEFARFIMENW